MNPTLERLGMSPRDRALMIHADDVGMCHGTLPAYAALRHYGTVPSGSTMAPCPWFLESVAWAVEHPGADLGLHLTLTSEWPRYRWRAIHPESFYSDLTDDRGFFRAHWPLDAPPPPIVPALREAEAQLEWARGCGLDPTHLDSHMFVLLREECLSGYLDLALRHRIPAVVSRVPFNGHPYSAATQAQVLAYEEARFPVFDRMLTPGVNNASEGRLGRLEQLLRALQPGLNYLYCHPSMDGPDLRSIGPAWACRFGDYEALGHPRFLKLLREQSIHLVTFRELIAGNA